MEMAPGGARLFFRLLPRMILFDLVKITLLSLVGVSGLLMMVGAMIEATRQGLDPLRVLAVMPFLIPPTLPYTLPTCVLFAATVVYGQLSSSNQITALKAAGIHVRHALLPVVFLGVGMAGLGVYLANSFIPECNRKLTQMILSDLQSNLYAYLSRQGFIIEKGFPYEIYVKSVRGDKLLEPIIKRRNASGAYDLVIMASEATLRVDFDASDHESNEPFVRINMVDASVASGMDNSGYVREKEFRMPAPESVLKHEDKMENLSLEGCLKRADAQLDFKRRADFELACLASSTVLNGSPAGFVAGIEANRKTAEQMQRNSREASAEVHLRLAQSMATIPFVLLGCPISILFQRREFLQTFFACFLPIITLFYPAMILSFNIYKEGQGYGASTLWLPSLAMCLLAIPVTRRVIRY